MSEIKYVNDLSGKVFFIVAFKQEWPEHLEGGNYKQHLRDRGATVTNKFRASADYFVVGNARYKGRADTLREIKKQNLDLLDEIKLIQLLRLDLSNKNFTFFGDFNDDPNDIVKVVNAQMSEVDDADFVVLCEGRKKGKAAMVRKVNSLIAKGKELKIIHEQDYLSFFAFNCSASKTSNFPTLVLQLRNVVNANKLDRAIKMLQEESYNLYTDITDDEVAGIVQSQTNVGYYAPWINKEGQYACCDEEISGCFGLGGQLCKHILVLLLGLAHQGEISVEQALEWATTAKPKKPSKNEDKSAFMLLRYKGVKTGQVDWRPTETIPEDFYLM
ncbi:MAG: hypothetical protein KAG19_05455 [Methylococcales bacterium]|nr:hypothetical protein [Methylococcales bacterium]